MEGQLTNFIRALRSADVRVSTAEAIDAARAVELVGYADRGVLKTTLDCVLAKSAVEHEIYDRLFDLYFARQTPPRETSEDDGGTSEDGETSESGQASANSEGEEESAPSMLELAQSGDQTAMAMALERAGDAAQIDRIQFSTQVSFFTRKMLEEMGVRELESELIDRLRDTSEPSQDMAQQLMDARAQIQAEARAYVEQRFEVFGQSATENFMDEFVSKKGMHQLDQRDMERMKVIIARIAKRLAVKYSRRVKKKNRGVLDARKTLRANAGVDGIPFNVHWKQKKKDRPKLIVICDVSSSVSQYVRFLLLLVYSLNDVVPDIHSYAFSHRLQDVSDMMERMDFEQAFHKIVHEIGAGSTDYGQAWSDMKVKHWDAIDRRSTIIVLGDGRSNYGDPRMDLFKEATSRAKQTIWLCPEHPGMWGSGDSVIPRYQPYCTTLSHCTNVKDLERAIDEVLGSYT